MLKVDHCENYDNMNYIARTIHKKLTKQVDD